MTPRSPAHDLDETVRFRAHWTMFLPVLIVALLYGGLWLFLLIAGKGDTSLATLLLLVLLLVVPVLLVRSYLRYASFGLLIGRQALTYRRGWLRPRWQRVQMEEVTGAHAAQSPLGRLFGGGALIISRIDNRVIRLYDVDGCEEAARQISRRLRVVRTRLKPV